MKFLETKERRHAVKSSVKKLVRRTDRQSDGQTDKTDCIAIKFTRRCLKTVQKWD